MKEKIEEILESVDLLRCIETNPSNFWDSASYDDLVERLTTLIQEERKDAVEKYTTWLMDNGYCDSDVIDEGGLEEYLSSIGKDK